LLQIYYAGVGKRQRVSAIIEWAKSYLAWVPRGAKVEMFTNQAKASALRVLYRIEVVKSSIADHGL
jgi:hypothetical protein